jgi:AcrR family transcriptional regulator
MADGESQVSARESASPQRVYRGTRPGGRSARVRRAVLEAALVELVAAGYDELSLPRVAERAGVALSTIHRRWDGKAALVAEAISEVTEEKVPEPDFGDVRSDLLALARSVAAMLSEPVTIQVLRTAFALPDPELVALRERHWEPRYAVARAVVDRAIARGELPAGLDGWLLVEAIHARIWMRVLVTGLPVDDELITRSVDQALAAARRGELA